MIERLLGFRLSADLAVIRLQPETFRLVYAIYWEKPCTS